mgnify:FL=1
MSEEQSSYYCLRIWVEKEHLNELEKVLAIKSDLTEDDLGSDVVWWQYVIELSDNLSEDYFLADFNNNTLNKSDTDKKSISYIQKLVSILENKYEQLNKIGIKRSDISIWYLYAYNGQCNMEFLPEDMLLLGKEGISFCVSCWDIHDYDADEYDENGKLAEEDNIE